MIELLIITALIGIAMLFWGNMCSDTWSSCIGSKPSIWWFFFFCLVRPFVFTPAFFIAMIAGDAFGIFWGTLLTCLGNIVSSVAVYAPAKILGKHYSYPWIHRNLPETGKIVRTHGFKIATFIRFIPIVPFDLATLIFGLSNIRIKHSIFATALASLPIGFLFCSIGYYNTPQPLIVETFKNLMILSLGFFGVLIVHGFFTKDKGGSLWNNIKKFYQELLYEIKVNNDIFRTDDFSSDKPPVILLYGFFSSRRAVVQVERRLRKKGVNVMSFNLGGLLGVFFTIGIKDAAKFLRKKINRQIDRHGFQKLQIIAYSKGGLVAMWYILKLGGHKYVDRIITMAAPFHGTYYTYLALITPLGFIWKDMWQMRPGSKFIETLEQLEIPENLEIFCFYGTKDTVARGRLGVFKHDQNHPQIRAIPFEGYYHFDFLHFQEVVDKLIEYLDDQNISVDNLLSEAEEDVKDTSLEP